MYLKEEEMMSLPMACRICGGPVHNYTGICAEMKCQRVAWEKTLDKALEPPQAALEKRVQELEERSTRGQEV